MPEFIRAVSADGVETRIPAIQVWCDPRHPLAHEDKALRAFLGRRGREGLAAIIRYGSHEAFVLIPPSMTSDGDWHVQSGQVEKEHSIDEILEVLNA